VGAAADREALAGLTSTAGARFSAATKTRPESGMANLVYRRQFTVEWGHCDPAGIVFNSRFFEFFDWSSWLLFETALGVRPNELGTTFGIVGIPLVDAKARFLKPAQFNDVADIASEVSEFRRSSFEVRHRITIAGQLAVEGSETRVWAARDPNDPVKLKGIPIPAAVIERFQVAA
jgi:4-hydroxybenzoyl-CoA thioesterase